MHENDKCFDLFMHENDKCFWSNLHENDIFEYIFFNNFHVKYVYPIGKWGCLGFDRFMLDSSSSGVVT